MSKKFELPPGFSLIGVTVQDLPGSKQVASICEELNGQIINFYSMNMDDLTIIAKYRVLPVPTLLLIKGTKVIARVVRDIPTLIGLRRIFNKMIKE